MDAQPIPELEQAYADFLADLDPIEGALPLEPPVAEFVALARESAFQAGWNAHQRLVEATAPVSSIVSDRFSGTVRALAEIGDHAWVQPLAILEDMTTGARFVDPRFSIAMERSAHHCVELMVTEAGLVAAGPIAQHRLCATVNATRVRPLAGFEARQPA